MADRSSEADGGRLGKFAVRGVDTLRVGLVDMFGGQRTAEMMTDVAFPEMI